MDKNIKAAIQAVKDGLTSSEEKLSDHISTALLEVTEQKNALVGLKDDLQAKYDDMDEDKQESDNGTDLSDMIDKLESVIERVGELEDALDESLYEDSLDELKEILA